jgi:hypothetical protein
VNYQKCIGRNIEVIKGDKYKGCEKLVPHLYDHKNYVIHYRNLKFLVELGVEVTAIHKTLSI